MIGYFSVFRGFVNVTGGATAKRTSGEWNEVTSTNERSLEILQQAELTLLSGACRYRFTLGSAVMDTTGTGRSRGRRL